jgi:OPT family oligopeptide transporter
MGSAAANAPLAMEVLAVLKLYYNLEPKPMIAILLLWSSQCIGYGFAGLMRSTLVYPTKMLYPYNLPITSMLEALHGDKHLVAKKLRVFKIGFFVLFVYEVFPAYIMPILVGVSVFCLAKQDSIDFTRIFGGAGNNEGLGVLEWSFDWQYIANPSPLWYPLQTLVNNYVGYILCVIVFSGVYYGNIWDAKKFPFMSQALFTAESNGTNFEKYNQTAVMNTSSWTVDSADVAAQGLPWMTATFVVYILATNLSVTATFSHLMLWNYDDIKGAWQGLSFKNIKKTFSRRKEDETRGTAEDTETDPHYRLMLAYKDVPNWWFAILLIISLIFGMVAIYSAHSTLPWWSFLIATVLLSPISILFFGAQFAITGFQYNVQTMVQMLAGYLHPGKPMANMYFVLFGYNSVVQSQLLLRDLKFGQYAHLSPRCTFTMQLIGTFFGSISSYLMMSSITTVQKDALLTLQGNNIWSGQNVQTFNSQAFAWGGFAKQLFSAGGRYQWVTWSLLIGFILPLPFWFAHKLLPKWRLDYWNTALIANYVGLLNVGISSVTTPWFVIGAFSQFYLRKYRPNWFIKYNYILSAAMEGGTQVLVFILSFAVFGGAGKTVSIFVVEENLS